MLKSMIESHFANRIGNVSVDVVCHYILSRTGAVILLDTTSREAGARI
jgi:hypothetical protein